MDTEQFDRQNLLAMKLLHYFITEKNYNPIILQGIENEIWLENLNETYKIVRIVSSHIQNEEQLDYDLYRTQKISSKIKRKTFTFKMKMLSIFVNIENDVKFGEVKNIDCISMYETSDIEKYKNVLEVFPDINEKIEHSEKGIELFLKLSNDINRKNKKDTAKVEKVFKHKKPVVTLSIIAINVIVFILMYCINANYADYAIENFGLHGCHILNNEWYRLLTAAFLHGNIIHLLANMYSLYVIGSQLEDFEGKVKFLIIYLISALSGSILSIIFNNMYSIGASGAIFGLLGSILYFGYHYRVYLGNVLKTQIIPIIVLNLAVGFLMPEIDVFAHIGGLVGGAFITMGLGVEFKSSKSERINGLIVTALYLAAMIFMALTYINYC